MSSSIPSIPVARDREERISRGREARRARNREAIRQRELVSLPETIRILKADMDVALSKGNTTLAKAKATAIENCRARLARAQQEPS